MAAVFRRALLLSSSSRFSDCESAALLFKLCLIWTPTSQRNWFQPELLLNLEKSLMLNEQMTQAVNAAVVQAANSSAAGHDGEKLVKTVRFLIKQSDFQLIQKLVKSQCLHLITQ